MKKKKTKKQPALIGCIPWYPEIAQNEKLGKKEKRPAQKISSSSGPRVGMEASRLGELNNRVPRDSCSGSSWGECRNPCGEKIYNSLVLVEE